jgi:hypothetical protein
MHSALGMEKIISTHCLGIEYKEWNHKREVWCSNCWNSHVNLTIVLACKCKELFKYIDLYY